MKEFCSRIGLGLFLCLGIHNACGAIDSTPVLAPPVYTNGQWWLPVTCEAGFKVVIESSADAKSWTPIATNYSSTKPRLIPIADSGDLSFYRAWRAPIPLFPGAITVTLTASLQPNDVRSDGFDSLDPNYSTDHRYDPTKTKASGDIISCATNALLFGTGNRIAGYIYTVQFGSLQWASNCSVGDLSWVANQLGLQPGHWKNDVVFASPDVLVPEATWLAAPAGGTIDGTLYGHVFALDGFYQISDTESIYVGTNVHATLLATNISEFNPPAIRVAGGDTNNSGTLTIYVCAPSLQLNSSMTTQSGIASGLIFYGTPSCTNITLAGDALFTGLVYAPQADCVVSNATANTLDVVGATVTRTLTATGSIHFHYDEAMRRLGPFR